MLTRTLPIIRSRQIVPGDANAVVDLLTRGFPIRGRDYWSRAFARLEAHATPPGLPKYGYLLEGDGVPVGVILLIFSSVPVGAATTVRCNVSSWYVEPAYRSHAALLISLAIKHKDITYLNISPAMHTRPIVEAQGFVRYSTGQFVTLPALSAAPDNGVVVTEGDAPPGADLASSESELVTAHLSYGCRGFWCISEGHAHPFVLLPRRVKGVVPCGQLVYCREIGDFIRFARPLGRYLAKRGMPIVIINSDGPIPGVLGTFFGGKSPKYFKGHVQPGFGDIAYTEAVMFGL